MSVNRPRKRRRLMAEMNVVPYIDVMLVLLIIFMVTAPLITQGVKVDLPKAASEAVASEREPVIVSVDHAGNFYISFGESKDKPADSQALVNKVSALLRHQPGTQFLVKGDASVSYQRVVELMALLQGAGVQSVGLITEPPDL